MEQKEMKNFMLAQIEEIEKHKWILGEQLGHDPGPSAVKDWILKYSKDFRDFWNEQSKN